MKILMNFILFLSLTWVPCLADVGPTQFDIMEDSLQQTLPLESHQAFLHLSSKDGNISNPQVGIIDIKDAEGRSLPPEDITFTLDNQGKVTALGTKVTVTIANPQHFERTGNYKILFRLQGTAPDNKPVILTKTLAFNRPASEINIDELKDRTIDLYKWPGGKASKTVSYYLFQSPGKAEITGLSAYGQEIMVANTKVVAPGKVDVEVVSSSQKGQRPKVPPPAGQQSDQPEKRIQLRIGLSDLTWSGSFVTNLVLYAPSIGDRKLIPVNLRVKDKPLVPFLVIVLGVIGGFIANRLSKRWLPHQRNEYRLVKLKGELDRLYAVTVNPEGRKKLYTWMERLDAAREKNDAGEVDISDIAAVETDLNTFRQERAVEFGKTQADSQRLRDQVREYLKYPSEKDEAQKILDALSGVEGHLTIDELDRAKEELKACQESFDKLRKNHLTARLATYEEQIKNSGLATNDPKLATINPLIQEIEGCLAKNQLDQLPDKLNALQDLIAKVLPLPASIAKVRSQDEIAAEAMKIEISPAPENRIVNANITFNAKISTGTLKPDDQLQWRFGDGGLFTGKAGKTVASHRFGQTWNYQVECSILRDGVAVEDLPPVTVMILPGPSEKALKEILRKMWINDAILSGFALVLAALTGLLALYVDKPFGSLENYLLAFLWGFGIDASIRGFSNISKKITE